jgi:hypothetical protein
MEYRHFTVYQSYILQYRASQEIKYFLGKIMYFIFSTVTREAYTPVEIGALNRILVNEGSDILHQFLIDAEVDLGHAIDLATNKINTPGFFCRTAKGVVPTVQVNNKFTQVNQVVNNYYEVNSHERNLYSFHEHNATNHYSYTKVVNMSVVGKEGEVGRGKEKGVFSKKQLLILFDLVSEEARIEAIDLGRPNKFDGFADLLHALTGKSKETWMEELKDYQNKSLYEAYTLGELRELINSITTIANVFRAAGFRSVAKIADKKISELEKRKKTWDQ